MNLQAICHAPLLALALAAAGCAASTNPTRLDATAALDEHVTCTSVYASRIAKRPPTENCVPNLILEDALRRSRFNLPGQMERGAVAR